MLWIKYKEVFNFLHLKELRKLGEIYVVNELLGTIRDLSIVKKKYWEKGHDFLTPLLTLFELLLEKKL